MKELIMSIISHTEGHYDSEPNSITCSMCGSSASTPYEPGASLSDLTLEDIVHNTDCPYMLALEIQQRDYPELIL